MVSQNGRTIPGQDGKHTKINFITQERSPVELVVELNEGPVSGESVGCDVHVDGLDVDDLANQALVQNGPVLRDLVMEFGNLADLLLRVLY